MHWKIDKLSFCFWIFCYITDGSIHIYLYLISEFKVKYHSGLTGARLLIFTGLQTYTCTVCTLPSLHAVVVISKNYLGDDFKISWAKMYTCVANVVQYFKYMYYQVFLYHWNCFFLHNPAFAVIAASAAGIVTAFLLIYFIWVRNKRKGEVILRCTEKIS